MSLVSLAIRNIKNNFSKYIMYFFSLTFSVFTVYSFLALIYNEQVLSKFIYSSWYRAMLIGFGIVIFAFVMFFLISSNTSFIRARKREISTYSLFGMTNRKIGLLLFIETLMVGMVAIVIGLGLGIFSSKLVAMVLLNITLTHFVGDITFSIVPTAIRLTVIPFILVFCLMGLSGLREIKRFELVDLFKGGKVPETNFQGSVIVLILSLLLIGFGYYLATVPDQLQLLVYSIPILALVIIGTYLFFWGGLPKLLNWFKRNKRRYYRGENLVATSVFAHRINSISTLMASIAILSAVATTAIATGFTLYANAEKNAYDVIGWDMWFYGNQDQLLDDVFQAFEKHNVKILDVYTTDRYQVMPRMELSAMDDEGYSFTKTDYFRIYPESVYNRLIRMSRGDFREIHVKPGEAAYIPFSSIDEVSRDVLGKMKVVFSNSTLTITSLENGDIVAFGAYRIIVVNDSDYAELMENGDIITGDTGGEPFDQVTVFKYQNPLGAHELNKELNGILAGNVGSFRLAYNHYIESLEVYGVVCFIGYFMSVVFILMTASLLYFKQIMAAEEEQHLYKMLRKIGFGPKAQSKVIAKRLLPVFLIPLLVGILHSVFAMKSADTMVFAYMIPVENSYLVVLKLSAVMYSVYALVYGIFYFITKRQYTRIVAQ